MKAQSYVQFRSQKEANSKTKRKYSQLKTSTLKGIYSSYCETWILCVGCLQVLLSKKFEMEDYAKPKKFRRRNNSHTNFLGLPKLNIIWG